jgi:anion-transporting  ArsA/GET3 family ATPase
MSARLHVLLGEGGVGKTTLAAGFALALARDPRRKVGLLGIDPSRRLKDALQVALGDSGVGVPGFPSLQAAVLEPAMSLRRWAIEASAEPEMRERLFKNTFFLALADHLATATDIFAAARLAEWDELDPELTDLVVDTAPGLNAIEFLTRPERVAAFLGGRLIGRLRWLAHESSPESFVQRIRARTQRIFGGLLRIAGASTLFELAEFFSLVEAMFGRMLTRVDRTRRWLRDPATHLLVVASVRQDAASGVERLLGALEASELSASAVILNRALPLDMEHDVELLERAVRTEPRSRPLVQYALSYGTLQAELIEHGRSWRTRVVLVPEARGLHGSASLSSLAEVGGILETRLRTGVSAPVGSKPRSDGTAPKLPGLEELPW